jgi:excisionase family DNA binding protein
MRTTFNDSGYAERYTGAHIVPRIHTPGGRLYNSTVDASPELLTTDQVMDRLLSDERLRRVAVTCVLPAVRVGQEWRFRKSDLDDWISRQFATLAGAPLFVSRT